MSDTDAPKSFMPHTLKEMAEILVRHHGLHEGRYELTIQFKISVGSMGPCAAEALPGAMLGIGGFGLSPATTTDDLPHIVDAAVVNPKRKPSKPRTNKDKAR